MDHHHPADKNADEFRDRCSNICRSGFIALAISVGHHMKLFDHIPGDKRQALSCLEIAQRSGCRERYVREWLGAMVCAQIVEYDNGNYWLPEWRQTLLNSEASEHTIPMIHMIAHLCSVFDKVTSCFQPSGPQGTEYCDYANFHTLLSNITDKTHRGNLIEQFIPSIEGLAEKLENGIHVLDIGCGHGTPGLLMAQKYPKSTFYGIDICTSAIEYAQSEAAKLGLTNVHFLTCCAATGMPEDWMGRFDYATAFDAIHDQAYPAVVLEQIHRVLKPGGMFSMIDVRGESDLEVDSKCPSSAVWYTVSLMHCMPVSLNFENGAGLGTMWGKRVAQRMLANAGLQLISINEMPYNSFNYHYLCRKP